MTSPYRDAAEQVGAWLISVAARSSDGWCWGEKPGVEVVEPGVGWGTGGPPMFFVELFRTTGDDRWLVPALEAERWMHAHLEELSGMWAGCGLFTGVGGWAVFAEELAAATGDDGHRELAARVLELVADRAEPADGGVHWHGYTEILWGTAGIGCLLIGQGRPHLGDRALDLATRAGDWLLGLAQPAPGAGVRWTLGPAWDTEFPDRVRYFPNFAHGAAGIGFFLARLAQATGEDRFLRGAKRGADWIMTTARVEDDTCAAYHHDDGGTDLFTLGWCHGPPGLGWFFRQMEMVDGGVQWRPLIRACARADSTSGIPERREPGFWDNVARCCGSAGVAEFFLDLHTLEGGDADLAFARLMVDDLLERATVDDGGMRWSNIEFRDPDPVLPPEPTYLQGASGIGSTLCRMDRHLRGDPWVVDWPHAPAWSREGPASSRHR